VPAYAYASICFHSYEVCIISWLVCGVQCCQLNELTCVCEQRSMPEIIDYREYKFSYISSHPSVSFESSVLLLCVANLQMVPCWVFRKNILY